MAVSRRSRRRPVRWLFVAILATVAVLLTNAALRAHPSQAENTLAYLDQVRPEIQSSADEGADLRDVRASAITLGRDGISRRLDRLVAQTNATLTAVTGLTPPTTLRVAHAYLVAALGVRAKTAGDAKKAMDAALAQGPPDSAIDGLVGVGQEMELSDRAYGLFTGGLPSSPPPPGSTWVPDPTPWTIQEVSAFVTTLRSSTSLIPIVDLAIVTFATDPAAVGVDNGATVIPPTRGMQVSIVVANVGNQAVKHATVTATLFTNGDNTTDMVRDFVDLVPGQRVAIKIGSLHPQSGTTGTLTIAVAPVTGETNVANNSQQEPVELR